MSNKKELTTVNENEELMFSVNDQELMSQMSADASEYAPENAREDITTPRLKLLQDLSPETKKNEAKFIEGAEVGDMVEVLSSTVYKGDKGMLFIPVKNLIAYLEWQGVGKNSKLINNYGSDATLYLNSENDGKGNKLGTKPDSRIVKTYNFYGYVYDMAAKSVTTLVIPMSNSKSKIAKEFNTLIQMRTDKDGQPLPAFAGVYKLTSVAQTNEKGTYFNFKVKSVGLTLGIPEAGPAIYKNAKDLYKMLSESTPDLAFGEGKDEEDERV